MTPETIALLESPERPRIYQPDRWRCASCGKVRYGGTNCWRYVGPPVTHFCLPCRTEALALLAMALVEPAFKEEMARIGASEGAERAAARGRALAAAYERVQAAS